MAALICLVLVVACGGDGDDSTPSPSPSPSSPTAAPTQTQPAVTPDPALRDKIPLDHIVVLMQENHSFDNYFGQLRKFDPTLDVEALTPDASNPDPRNPTGAPIPVFHEGQLCASSDLDHSWNGTHLQYNGGKMDGFTTTNAAPSDPSGSRAMGYYDETDLPFYYGLYSTFAIGDRYFSSLMGPTQPNRFYLYAGTSFGRVVNGLPPSGTDFSQPSLFNLLDQAGVTWKIYSSQFPYAAFFAYVRNNPAHIVSIANYYTDAAAGQLPQVAFVDPAFVGQPNTQSDEHPPANVQVGQKFVADVVNALLQSPAWPSSALFLAYDEHGGYYDHVPPPPAPPPDDIPPMTAASDGFDRYGIRVPVAVISPFAKRHFVSHVVHDHTSILRFIETRFGLPALTRRDEAADPMLEFFDFEAPQFTEPPKLPEAVVDQGRLC